MLPKITLPVMLQFDDIEIQVIMLCIWGFSQKQVAAVTDLELKEVKAIIRKLCDKLHGENSGNMAFHAQLLGFKLDGTVNNQDIFNNTAKLKILDIDPAIEFKFPPLPEHPKKKAA